MSLLDDDLLDGGEITDERQGTSEPLTLLTFRLGPQVFAVNVGYVREIVDICEITPFPGAPHGVIGMIDLRKETITIMDLASRMGFSSTSSPDARIVVFNFGDEEDVTSLGVVADQVLRVCEVDPSSIEALPDTKTGWQSEDIESLARTEDGAAMILAIERILCQGADLPGEFDFG